MAKALLSNMKINPFAVKNLKLVMGCLFVLFTLSAPTFSHTVITVSPEVIEAPYQTSLKSGFYLVPKTEAQFERYLNSPQKHDFVRVSAIESALNNSKNLSECLALLESFTPRIKRLLKKDANLLLVIAKMPPWLSSSRNPAPSSQVGWSVLHTKPPADIKKWANVISEIVKLVKNKWGISAFYEIWNEPDLGYWTGSEGEYLSLFKATALAIKTADAEAKIGGPALNSWANSIDRAPPLGYLSYSEADKGLLGKLLSFTKAENIKLDFVSWHSFHLNYREIDQSLNYLTAKCRELNISVPPVFISEWNAPSEVRDNQLGAAFMPVLQIAMARPEIASNQVAAWADFDDRLDEFHRDYGLNSYQGIEKPALYSLQLSQKLRGNKVKSTSNALSFHYATVNGNTLQILVSNYSPPPILEAVNEVLYDGKFTVKDLEAAGYINTSTKNFSKLEDVYKGKSVLSGNTTLEKSINKSIKTYSFFNLLSQKPRDYEINIPALRSKSVTAEFYVIDSEKNNNIFKYESLRKKGLSKSKAAEQILSSQKLESEKIKIQDGKYKISLKPNAVLLLEIDLMK